MTYWPRTIFMRFIGCFTAENRLLLMSHLLDKTLLDRERKRFSCIFLSSVHRVSIEELSDLFSVTLNSISAWFDSYESGGLAALLDANMAHSKSTLSLHSEAIILFHVKQSPQNIAGAVASLSAHENITTHPSILRNYLKKKASYGGG